MESQAATTTAGIYCNQCGYDLRASKDAGRCPECGRVFSPDDPNTFRRRPFAAPWKRALGRWTKRAARLLLVLAVLLAGLWGWLYRGWKQEQAVLTQVGLRPEPHDALLLGGPPARWLHDRHVPGSFVLERVQVVGLGEGRPAVDLLPLRKLPWLERLFVASDVDLAQLRKVPQVRMLLMGYPRHVDAGLASLRDLPRLEELWLFHEISIHSGSSWELPGRDGRMASLTDAELAALATFPQLKKLCLFQLPITDASLVQLVPLRKLRALTLQGVPVTDAGLVHLEKLRGLEYLDLQRTQITPAGVARLKAALPGCRIIGP